MATEQNPVVVAPALHVLSQSERLKLFGEFEFTPAPQPTNPEGIKINGTWAADNIVMVEVPQLGKLNHHAVSFHKLGAKQLQDLWAEWEKENLLEKVLTFDGSWVPRYKRKRALKPDGTPAGADALSNHSWGSAFDINYRWNLMGMEPVASGQKGSVRDLVEIAHKHGFFWGGDFHAPWQDGMHFELAKLIK